MHYVTGFSRDCVEFASHGRCKHYSELLVALVWVVDTTLEPDPIIMVDTGYEHDQVAAWPIIGGWQTWAPTIIGA